MSKEQYTIGYAGETAAGIYNRLAEDRSPYIRRAEKAADYTIPSVFPREGSTSATEYRTPFQSLGARGLNNLTSKILLAIMPPNTTYFRLSTAEHVDQELREGNPDIVPELESKLARREQKIMRYQEINQYRITVGEAIKQVIVAGNALLFLPPKERGIKLYKLTNFVQERDGLGAVFNIVALDCLSFASCPDKLQELLAAKAARKPQDEIKIYTHTWLAENDTWYSYQEVEGEKIPGSEQEYPKDKSPWIPIRMVKVDGESYGRGYIEEHQGDLEAYDKLCQAILEYAAVCARIIWLVNPNGQTQARRLQKAKTGDFVPGLKKDLEALSLEKYNDFRVAKEQADTLATGLSLSFLLNSAVQRQAERVTAEEIKYVARELEDTLGGIYSILSQELQLPLVRRTTVQMEQQGELEELPEGAIEPQITTGLEALGRGHDLDKLQAFREFLTDVPGAAAYLKLGGWLLRIATALNLDISGLVKSEEEVQAAIAQDQMNLMSQRAAPQIADAVAQQMQNQPEGGQ